MFNLLAISMPRREPFWLFTFKETARKLSIGVSELQEMPISLWPG